MDKRKFNRGTLGNKGGRKTNAYKKRLKDAIEMIISTDEIIFQMANIVMDDKSTPADKIKASTFLIDQMHGKARQSVEVEVNSLLDGRSQIEIEQLENASKLMLEMREDINDEDDQDEN